VTTIFERVNRNLFRSALTGVGLSAVMFLFNYLLTLDDVLSGAEAIILFFIIPFIYGIIGGSLESYLPKGDLEASNIGWVVVCLIVAVLPMFGLFAGMSNPNSPGELFIIAPISSVLALFYWVILDYVSFGDD